MYIVNQVQYPSVHSIILKFSHFYVLSDVGVMHEVIRRVKKEAEIDVIFDTDPDQLNAKQRKAIKNNQAAKLINGLIDRGVVKRTVMTSVYGVTYIGARQQIQEKIEEKVS